MDGLTTKQAHELLKKHGHNILPRAESQGIFWIFIKQFLNPLIYILLVAAIIAIFLGEMATGLFIFILLFINSTIGATQERSAQKAVISLQNFIPSYVQVLRDGKVSNINSEELVPNDIIFLESGNKVPADVILLETNNLTVNESFLTGESMPIPKEISNDAKKNKLFAGTLIIKGRTKAQIIATGLNTKLGAIATSVGKSNIIQSPLLNRIEKFTYYLSTGTIIFIIAFSIFAWLTGGNFTEIFVLAVALAVAAIPEGLPTAITVALAVGVYRMSKSNVIIRKLLAIESLGSCTYIISDKTGTLTKNKLSIETIILPNGKNFIVQNDHLADNSRKHLKVLPQDLQQLILAGMLANEAHQQENGKFSGDVVDAAFLALGDKTGFTKDMLLKKYKQQKFIPYESENKFSAGIYSLNNKKMLFAKGGYEAILNMCSHIIVDQKKLKLNKKAIIKQVDALAESGYKIIALAYDEVSEKKISSKKFTGLSFLGIVAIADQLRAEAKNSIKKITTAGVKVAMVTGDHPITAFTVARKLGMNINKSDIVTNKHLNAAIKKGQKAVEQLVKNAQVFAHIEPLQKKTIVEALMRMGHYVAVTGDGVNDAPALKYATIGVAMGKDGTDIARDSADIILADNNFTSIVKGIIYGRAVYNNIRKVIFLLLSTGIAELILFLLSLLFNMPMPLLAIQLLWLNIIIHGIQDQALGFEPLEGDELNSPPRNPEDQIFDSFMTGRIFVASLYISIICFITLCYFLNNGYKIEEARNLVLMLLVLFGNIQALVSKSEHKSIIKINLFNNKFLFFTIIGSHLLHISVLHIPIFTGLFQMFTVSIKQWSLLLIIASTLIFIDTAYRYLFHKLTN